MGEHSITQATDCTVWANDDENKVEEPDGVIPVKNLPEVEEYDGLFEGGGILDDYETQSSAMATLHDDWRQVAVIWSSRLDELLAQVYVLDRVLQDPGTAPPIDEFEDFTTATFGFYAVSAFASVQAGYALAQAIANSRAGTAAAGKASVAQIGTQTPRNIPDAIAKESAKQKAAAKSVAKGAKAGKPFKTKGFAKGAGKFVLAAGTLASIAVIVIDLVNRNRSLAAVIPKFQSWMYGDDEDGKPIAEPVIPTEAQILDEGFPISVGGAAGRIIEMRRAIEDMKEAIRVVAILADVPLEDGDGNARDLTLVFCETRQEMNGRVRNASQVTAAVDTATRMLCIDHWDSAVTYSDTQISTVTGVPALQVGQLRTQVADDATNLCPGVAPGTGT